MKIKLAALLALLALLFASCVGTEAKEVTCGELVAAYEAAGYEVDHGNHNDEDFPYECSVRAHKSSDDYVYFCFYWTEAAAKDAAETDEYNVVKWIFFLPFGEYRWLRSGVCGRMTYSCYDAELLEPYEKLLKTK